MKEFSFQAFLSKFSALVFFLSFCAGSLEAQKDSVHLQPVEILSTGSVPSLNETASMKELGGAEINLQTSGSLLPSFNNVAGLRLDERSPGSYRLSIRGSLLRSPFGVRNIKIYGGAVPLTNAGGETYFNLLDQFAIRSASIYKGPDGSLYGANSGGVIQMQFPTPDTLPQSRSEIGYGSYGLFRAALSTGVNFGKSGLNVTAAFQKSEGYRDHSAMQRGFGRLEWRSRINSRHTLSAFAMFGVTDYETPGGLTLSQAQGNPTSARPGTHFSPSPVVQKAGVMNNTLWSGLVHYYNGPKGWSTVSTVFGSGTDFKNPFITNYETRRELNLGARSTVYKQFNSQTLLRTFSFGGEWQTMWSRIGNFENDYGVKGKPLGEDQAENSNGFLFSRFRLESKERFSAEASLSYNLNHSFIHNNSTGQESARWLKPQLMPRLVGNLYLTRWLGLRALVSRGYSPPTLQELRPAPNAYNKDLQPEQGWNYEAGLRMISLGSRFRLDVTGFYYRLESAIARQVDSIGQESFHNAGSTRQPGLEVEMDWILARFPGFLQDLELSGSLTAYNFRFGEYRNKPDVEGLYLTGVADHTYFLGITLRTKPGFFAYLQYNYISRLPLNDLNTEWSRPVDLVTARLGWRHTYRKLGLEFSLAGENLLDKAYTAGYDLNAFGGRYYNPAAPRNYYLRLMVTW